MINCPHCKKSFKIYQDEKEFLKKMNFQFGKMKITLPEPVQCPDCRQQNRTAHRNEQYLYQRKSDFSGKQLISLYSEKPASGKPLTVYSQEEWQSDKWDPLSYGRDFDFNRSFFEQFAELSQEVPRKSLITLNNENSPYTTGTGYCKNCHLINSSEYCEDCYYGKLLQNCKDSVDNAYLYDSERCYECFNVRRAHKCIHLYYSQNCSDCYFSEKLTGCHNCFLSTNLNNKEYYFMNKPLDKKEYQKRIEEFLGSHKNFKRAKEILDNLRQKRIHKFSNITNSLNCTGDFIENCKNCIDCYDMNDSEDCRYVMVGVNIKDVYDCSNMYIKPELNYQVLGTIETYHVAFTLYAFHSQDVLYSEQIYHSKNLFGCVGLTNKQYCIFNKQYTKDEYEELVPKIVGHMKKTPSTGSESSTAEWGSFFPIQYSPHGYNESLAYEYYPLSKEETLKRGWNWHEEEPQAVYQGPDYEIPNSINDVDDEISERILKCESTEKLYKIIPQELRFYRNMNTPIPHHSPDQRHEDRMKLRNPRRLYGRSCQKCNLEIMSTYSPDRPEQIYCEKCYQNELA